MLGEEEQNHITEIMADDYEIDHVEKAIDDIMQSYEKDKLDHRKFEILQLLEGTLEVNQKKELEKELSEVIIRLAKIKQGGLSNFERKDGIMAKKKEDVEKVEEMKKEFCVLFNQKYDNTSYYIENGELVVKINVSDKVLQESGWTKGRKSIVEVQDYDQY